MTGIAIRRADYMDVDAVTPLFDAYRQFYRQPPDLDLARRFMADRLRAGDSVVFIARLDHRDIGFTQLYPSFTSTGAGRIFVLNDLYVDPSARRGGVAQALLTRAAEFAREEGAIRLTLRTATDNAPAQSVYEGLGWVRDTAFVTYDLTL